MIAFFKRLMISATVIGVLLACAYIWKIEAIELYMKALTFAAERGYVTAQYQLGTLNFMSRPTHGPDGIVYVRDLDAALQWLTMAARQGDPRAEYALGIMYSRDEGVRQDYKTAYLWFYRAAQQNYQPAKAAVADFEQHMPPAELDDAIANAKQQTQ